MKSVGKFLTTAWSYIKPHQKAIVSGLTAGIAMWLEVRGNGVTGAEWWAIIGAAAAGGGLTWLVPYLPKKAA